LASTRVRFASGLEMDPSSAKERVTTSFGKLGMEYPIEVSHFLGRCVSKKIHFNFYALLVLTTVCYHPFKGFLLPELSAVFSPFLSHLVIREFSAGRRLRFKIPRLEMLSYSSHIYVA